MDRPGSSFWAESLEQPEITSAGGTWRDRLRWGKGGNRAIEETNVEERWLKAIKEGRVVDALELLAIDPGLLSTSGETSSGDSVWHLLAQYGDAGQLQALLNFIKIHASLQHLPPARNSRTPVKHSPPPPHAARSQLSDMRRQGTGLADQGSIMDEAGPNHLQTAAGSFASRADPSASGARDSSGGRSGYGGPPDFIKISSSAAHMQPQQSGGSSSLAPPAGSASITSHMHKVSLSALFNTPSVGNTNSNASSAHRPGASEAVLATAPAAGAVQLPQRASSLCKAASSAALASVGSCAGTAPVVAPSAASQRWQITPPPVGVPPPLRTPSATSTLYPQLLPTASQTQPTPTPAPSAAQQPVVAQAPAALDADEIIMSYVNVANHLDQTPLMFAAFHGREDVVKVLMAQGADPWLADEYSRTAVHYACMKGHAACVRALLDNLSPCKQELEGIRYVDVPTSLGYTPLHFAVAADSVPCVRALLAFDALMDLSCDGFEPSEFRIACDPGSTPLHLAARAGRDNCAMALLRHYADCCARYQRHPRVSWGPLTSVGSASLAASAAAGGGGGASVRFIGTCSASTATTGAAMARPSADRGSADGSMRSSAVGAPHGAAAGDGSIGASGASGRDRVSNSGTAGPNGSGAGTDTGRRRLSGSGHMASGSGATAVAGVSFAQAPQLPPTPPVAAEGAGEGSCLKRAESACAAEGGEGSAPSSPLPHRHSGSGSGSGRARAGPGASAAAPDAAGAAAQAGSAAVAAGGTSCSSAAPLQTLPERTSWHESAYRRGVQTPGYLTPAPASPAQHSLPASAPGQSSSAPSGPSGHNLQAPSAPVLLPRPSSTNSAVVASGTPGLTAASLPLRPSSTNSAANVPLPTGPPGAAPAPPLLRPNSNNSTAASGTPVAAPGTPARTSAPHPTLSMLGLSGRDSRRGLIDPRLLRDYAGRTPGQVAFARGHLSLAQKLDPSADIDSMWSPADLAAYVNCGSIPPLQVIAAAVLHKHLMASIEEAESCMKMLGTHQQAGRVHATSRLSSMHPASRATHRRSDFPAVDSTFASVTSSACGYSAFNLGFGISAGPVGHPPTIGSSNPSPGALTPAQRAHSGSAPQGAPLPDGLLAAAAGAAAASRSVNAGSVGDLAAAGQAAVAPLSASGGSFAAAASVLPQSNNARFGLLSKTSRASPLAPPALSLAAAAASGAYAPGPGSGGNGAGGAGPAQLPTIYSVHGSARFSSGPSLPGSMNGGRNAAGVLGAPQQGLQDSMLEGSTAPVRLEAGGSRRPSGHDASFQDAFQAAFSNQQHHHHHQSGPPSGSAGQQGASHARLSAGAAAAAAGGPHCRLSQQQQHQHPSEQTSGPPAVAAASGAKQAQQQQQQQARKAKPLLRNLLLLGLRPGMDERGSDASSTASTRASSPQGALLARSMNKEAAAAAVMLSAQSPSTDAAGAMSRMSHAHLNNTVSGLGCCSGFFAARNVKQRVARYHKHVASQVLQSTRSSAGPTPASSGRVVNWGAVNSGGHGSSSCGGPGGCDGSGAAGACFGNGAGGEMGHRLRRALRALGVRLGLCKEPAGEMLVLSNQAVAGMDLCASCMENKPMLMMSPCYHRICTLCAKARCHALELRQMVTCPYCNALIIEFMLA